MWIVLVGAAIAAFVALAFWQGRLVSRAITSPDCERCGQRLTPVGDEAADPRSYQILACTGCAHLVPVMNGARTLYAWCPSCHQLSVEIEVRLSGPVVVGTLPEVDVSEACTLCDHRAARHLPEHVARRHDNVIPFRPSE